MFLAAEPREIIIDGARGGRCCEFKRRCLIAELKCDLPNPRCPTTDSTPITFFFFLGDAATRDGRLQRVSEPERTGVES